MRAATTLGALSIFLVTATALADVPNDPCMGATAGDSCTTLDGQDGMCVDVNGFLTCEEATATGTGGNAGTTSGAGASTGGDGGEGGSGTGDGDDGGCSVSAVGTTSGAAASLLLLAGLALSRRRRP